MKAISSALRRRQIVAWGIVSIFVLGFFTPVGVWTGPVLGAWLAGTQRVWRGFVLMIGFALLFGLPHLVHGLLHGGSGSAPAYLGWTMAAMVLSTLPFTFHRYGESTVAGMVFNSSIAHFWRPFRDDCGRMVAGWLRDRSRRQTKPATQLAPCLEAARQCS